MRIFFAALMSSSWSAWALAMAANGGERQRALQQGGTADHR